MPFKAIFTFLGVFKLVPRRYHEVILFWASKTIDGTIILSMHNLRLSSTLASLCLNYDRCCSVKSSEFQYFKNPHCMLIKRLLAHSNPSLRYSVLWLCILYRPCVHLLKASQILYVNAKLLFSFACGRFQVVSYPNNSN